MRSNNPERTLAGQQEFLNRFVSLPFDDNAAIIFRLIAAIHYNRKKVYIRAVLTRRGCVRQYLTHSICSIQSKSR